jgi:hypothetical protein
VGGNSGKDLIALRILRLGRVVRMLKLGKSNDGLKMIILTCVESASTLYTLVFVVLLICVLFGALLFVAERGTWFQPTDVCPDVSLVAQMRCGDNAWFPDGGAFLRPSIDGGMEVSPFKSILHTMWFVMVTTVTVGYGDMYPVRRPVIGVLLPREAEPGVVDLCAYVGVRLPVCTNKQATHD